MRATLVGFSLAAALSCPLALAQPSSAAAYPSKAIAVVVTFPPGGSTDLVARMLAPKVSERLGQQVIVENRPGAGGNVGMAHVAKSAPDGYTLGIGAAGALAANVNLYPRMPFDPVKDFEPITMLAGLPFVLVAHPSLPEKSLPELVRRAKAMPQSLSIAHGGNGTAMHLSVALLKLMAGIDLTAVAYKGSGPAARDVVGGHVPLAMVDLPASQAHIRAGLVNALAITGARRLSALPEVPTMSEAGIAGYEAVGWFGLVAPAGTPAAIIARLNAEFVAALKDPEIRNRIEAVGGEALPSSPEAFRRVIADEIPKWAQVVRAANVRLE